MRREDGGELRKDGCGDSSLRRGLPWQNGIAHHDRLVADNRTKYDLVSYCSCYSHFFNLPGLELSQFESSTRSMKENDVAERGPLPRRRVCVLSGELMPLLKLEWRLKEALT